MSSKMRMIKDCLVSILMGLACLSGDTLVWYFTRRDDLILRLICDSITHSTVAALGWIMIIIDIPNSKVNRWAEVLYCAAVSAFIDVDHFIASRSFNLHVS